MAEAECWLQSRRRAGGEIPGDLGIEHARNRDFDPLSENDNLFLGDESKWDRPCGPASEAGVPDVEATVAWYVDVLGLERLHAGEWGGVPTIVGKGATGLALFPRGDNANSSEGGAMLHLAFRTDRDGFVRAEEELRKRKISFHFEDHGISRSIYFRDLNGLRLEITTYELSERSLG